MNFPRIVLAVAFSGLFAVCSPVVAQSPIAGRYQIARPTFSPWLSLYQRNEGPLDNYNAFVRPQMELQNVLQNQNARLQQQATGLHTLSSQVTELEQGPSRRPTGTGSVFMNHLHYYPTSSTATPPRSWVPRPGGGGRPQ